MDESEQLELNALELKPEKLIEVKVRVLRILHINWLCRPINIAQTLDGINSNSSCTLAYIDLGG